MRAWAAAAAGLIVLAGAPLPAVADPPARVVYHFSDPRIDEASGIAVGVRSPGIDYVQNDSGDTNRFFAIDASTGETAATVTVSGATNVDWEDIAVAPDAAGTSSVWLADTGDNDATRPEVEVYRVDEPRVAPTDRDRTLTTRAADVWRLRYPSGPVNTESLAVTPRGTAYLVTKSMVGASVVYRLPARPDRDRVQTLTQVGTIRFTPRSTRTPLAGPGTLTATAASISPDGSLLAVRTYADAFLWRVRDDDVAAALRHRPTLVALPVQPQGEGIAISGGHLLVDSEGVGTAVYEVPLPAALTRPTNPPPSIRTPAASHGTAAGTGSAAPGPEASDGRSGGTLGWGIAAVAVLAALGGALILRRRRAG